MFVLLSGWLINFNHIKVVEPSDSGSKLYFAKGDYIIVTEPIEDIYERIQSAEKRCKR